MVSTHQPDLRSLPLPPKTPLSYREQLRAIRNQHSDEFPVDIPFTMVAAEPVPAAVRPRNAAQSRRSLYRRHP